MDAGMTPVFHGRVEKGKVVWEDPESVRKWTETLEGLEIDIIIRKKVNHKTDAQRKYYRGVVVKMISDETGQDGETVHEFLKATFLKHMEQPSTSGLSTKEMTEYIEHVRAWSLQDLNIDIPEPNNVHA